MPEDIQTWDTVSEPQPDATASETAVETVTDPPAETSTLETTATTPLEAEPEAVRESESEAVSTEPAKEEPKAEEYVAEADDPAEIAALSTPAAKRWAKRQFKDAEPIRDFQTFDKPISAFVDDLQKRSPSRHQEMVDDIATAYPDYLSQKLFGATAADIKSRLQGSAPTPTTPTPVETTPAAISTESPDTLLQISPDELENMTVDEVSERLSKAAQAQKAKEEKWQKDFDALKAQFDAVNGKITSEQSKAEQTEISSTRQEIYTKVWSVVEDGIRNSGLEVQPTDPPRIANLKTAAAKILRREAEPAFDAVEENANLVRHVFEATSRREFDAAMREVDNLKVRARAAFQSVKDSPEVNEILQQIQAEAQSKTSRPANPVPPAPGSSVGIVPKQPTTWDEAIAMTRAAAS